MEFLTKQQIQFLQDRKTTMRHTGAKFFVRPATEGHVQVAILSRGETRTVLVNSTGRSFNDVFGNATSTALIKEGYAEFK